jgi:hypothetical protein
LTPTYAHEPYFTSADNPLVFRSSIETLEVEALLADMRTASCLSTNDECTYDRGCLKSTMFSRSSHGRTDLDVQCGTLLEKGAKLIGINGMSYLLQQFINDDDQAMNNYAHRMGELAFEMANKLGNLRWAAEALAMTNDMNNHPIHGVMWAAINQAGDAATTWKYHSQVTGWGLGSVDRHMLIDSCHGVGHGMTFLMTGGYNHSWVTEYSNLTLAAETCANNHLTDGWGTLCAATCVDGIMHESEVALLKKGWLGDEVASTTNASYTLCAQLEDVHPVQCYWRLSSKTTWTIDFCRDFVATHGLSIVQLAACTSTSGSLSMSASTLVSDLSTLSDLEGDISKSNLDANGVSSPTSLYGAIEQGSSSACAQFKSESYALWMACAMALPRNAGVSINIGYWGYLPYYRPWVYSLAIQPGCAFSDDTLATVMCECVVTDMFADALLLGNREWMEALDMPLASVLAAPDTPAHKAFLAARAEVTKLYTARRDMLVATQYLPDALGGGEYSVEWGYTKDGSDYWTTAEIPAEITAAAAEVAAERAETLAAKNATE